MSGQPHMKSGMLILKSEGHSGGRLPLMIVYL
jgi:hypothetical protein